MLDDRPEGTDEAASDDPSRPARGPAPLKLDSRQRAELLKGVTDGKGIDLCLRNLGVSYRTYRNTYKHDKDFRQEVASARRAADQSLDEYGHLMATAPDGMAVLFKIWDRRDKYRLLELARKDRERERAQDLEQERVKMAFQLRLAEMAAEARAKERSGHADDDGPDVSAMPDEDMELIRGILAKHGIKGHDDGA